MDKKIKVRLEEGQIVEGVLVEEEVVSKKKTIIYNRYDNSIIYESDKETIKEAVEEAVSKSANLKFANLKFANLKSANLEDAKTEYCLVNFTKSEIEQAKQFIEGLRL